VGWERGRGGGGVKNVAANHGSAHLPKTNNRKPGRRESSFFEEETKHAAASNVNNAPFVADFCKKTRKKTRPISAKYAQKNAKKK